MARSGHCGAGGPDTKPEKAPQKIRNRADKLHDRSMHRARRNADAVDILAAYPGDQAVKVVVANIDKKARAGGAGCLASGLDHPGSRWKGGAANQSQGRDHTMLVTQVSQSARGKSLPGAAKLLRMLNHLGQLLPSPPLARTSTRSSTLVLAHSTQLALPSLILQPHTAATPAGEAQPSVSAR